MSIKMLYHKATTNDLETVVQLELQLWPHHTVEEMRKNAEEYLSNPEKFAVFLAKEGEQSVGLLMAALRTDYVEGSESSPVGYIEGIYVEEAYRNKGAAKELVRQLEQWSKEKGCTQIGSDAYQENAQSLAFHDSLGFEASKPIIHFIKDIS